MALSLCPGIRLNNEWYFATGADVTYNTVGVSKDAHGAYATL